MNPSEKKSEPTSIVLMSSIGIEYRLYLKNIFGLVFNLHMQTFQLCAFIFMFTLKPYEYLQTQPATFTVPYMLLTHYSIVLTLFAAWWALAKLGVKRVVTVATSVFCLAFQLVWTDQFEYYFLGEPVMSLGEKFGELIFTTIFLEIGISIVTTLMTRNAFGAVHDYHHIIEQLGQSKTPPAPPSPTTHTPVAQPPANPPESLAPSTLNEEPLLGEILDFGDAKIPANEIVRLQAEQSYVKIVTEHKSILVRGPFASTVGLLPLNMGRQIHRSHWVSGHFRVEVQMDHETAKLIVKTIDGAELPVTRTRTSEIQRWAASLIEARQR